MGYGVLQPQKVQRAAITWLRHQGLWILRPAASLD
jgi:hypothetical protein